MTMIQADTDPDQQETNTQNRRPWGRVKLLIRRIHLYAGLLMLPWVFLYGVTGAMFNHQSLFPDVVFQHVSSDIVADSSMSGFPDAGDLAQQIVDRLRTSASDTTIALAADARAEFTNDLMFEVNTSGIKHVVHIDPVSKSSKLITYPRNDNQPDRMLPSLNHIRLDPDPLDAARTATSQILNSAGIAFQGTPRPFGWTKLNFLAEVDGRLARITYVLKDGHLDIVEFNGDHGMSTRGFLMRLHTSHGQPPHWNGRMFWSLLTDAMAIAMVCWGLTGLYMWWQMKRTRVFGSLVIGISLIAATFLYFGMHQFHAATML